MNKFVYTGDKGSVFNGRPIIEIRPCQVFSTNRPYRLAIADRVVEIPVPTPHIAMGGSEYFTIHLIVDLGDGKSSMAGHGFERNGFGNFKTRDEVEEAIPDAINWFLETGTIEKVEE
jgi:hypothetical protein